MSQNEFRKRLPWSYPPKKVIPISETPVTISRKKPEPAAVVADAALAAASQEAIQEVSQELSQIADGSPPETTPVPEQVVMPVIEEGQTLSAADGETLTAKIYELATGENAVQALTDYIMAQTEAGYNFALDNLNSLDAGIYAEVVGAIAGRHAAAELNDAAAKDAAAE